MKINEPAPTLEKIERRTEMKCIRCEKDIENNAPANVVICGSCADDLRQDEEAERMSLANEANREAYEEAQHDTHFDDGNGYRYI
jgi:hypothetical protein